MRISLFIWMTTVFLDLIMTSWGMELLNILVICLINRMELPQSEKLVLSTVLNSHSMQLWKIYLKNSKISGMLILLLPQKQKLTTPNITLKMLKIRPVTPIISKDIDQLILNLQNISSFRQKKKRRTLITKEFSGNWLKNTIKWPSIKSLHFSVIRIWPKTMMANPNTLPLPWKWWTQKKKERF